MLTYALVSAARNEEEFIESTIQSVLSQTVLPVRWVIVSDGSTDATDEIVERYAATHDWIELLRASADGERNFGSKAKAVMAGYGRLRHFTFDCIGNLDADITFQPDYYERILLELENDPKLGLAGGMRFDLRDGTFVPVYNASNSVGGPYQLFRRDCFDQIGGYMSLQYGGIDAVAEISARMHGWRVKSFSDILAYHHRCTGTATRSVWAAGFRAGTRDYLIGYHPVFEVARSLRRMRTVHDVLYGSMLIGGYIWAAVHRKKRPVSTHFVSYLRNEQLTRLGIVASK